MYRVNLIYAPLAQLVEQLTLNQWVLGSSPRWCTKKSRNECCGFFVAPFPSGRTRTSRKRSCSSRGDWSLNSVRRTEFLTRPLMVHQSTRCKKLQRVFYCNLSKKVQSGAPSGDENRAAARSAVRNATVRRSLARGRVPDGAPEKAATNVAAFLLHHSLRDGLALRASARVRLAGTGR